MPRSTLLCLHGFLGFAADWQPVQQHLQEWGNCLTPDLPGHGATPLLPGQQSYASWTAWLAQWLQARTTERVILVGYSLGGRVALAFAAAYPQRVQALALLSAHPGLESPSARAERARADAQRAAQIRQQGLPPFLEGWYRLPLFALEGQPDVRAALVASRQRQDPAAMARVIEEMSPGRQPSLWGALAALRVPLLYLAGAHDEKYRRVAARVARHVPGGRVCILSGVGHMLLWQAGGQVGENLKKWLDFS